MESSLSSIDDKNTKFDFTTGVDADDPGTWNFHLTLASLSNLVAYLMPPIDDPL